MFSKCYVQYPRRYDIGDKAIYQFKWNSLFYKLWLLFRKLLTLSYFTNLEEDTLRMGFNSSETGSQYFIWLCVNMNTTNYKFINFIT